MWFVKTRTMAAVKSNHGGEMWFVKTRTMAAITIQPRWRNVVREDTNHGGCDDPNDGGEMWFVKTRTMAITIQTMVVKWGS
jgi:hypothetical protein